MSEQMILAGPGRDGGMTAALVNATSRHTAAIALPYRDARSATAGLRAELRQAVADADAGLPVWDTLVVSGPVPMPDRRGRTWFEYRATVFARRRTDAVVRSARPKG